MQPLNLKAVDSSPVQDRSSFLKHCLTKSNGHGFESHPRLLQFFFFQALSSLVVEVHARALHLFCWKYSDMCTYVSGCTYIHTYIHTHIHIYIYIYIQMVYITVCVYAALTVSNIISYLTLWWQGSTFPVFRCIHEGEYCITR